MDLRLKKLCFPFGIRWLKLVDNQSLKCPFQNFGTGREERNVTVIFSISAITIFANGNDGNFFLQGWKVVLFEAVVENNREGKGNVLISFNQKVVRKIVITRASIGILAYKVFDKKRRGGKEGNGRRNRADCIL